MKYSIIMPYYQRAVQLSNTLVSLQHHYGDRDDWELIIIEDCRDGSEALLYDTIQLYNANMAIFVTAYINKDCHNPAPLFNQGVHRSVGKYVILTSPECFHQSNILAVMDDEFARQPDCYVVCACVSAANESQQISKMEEFNFKFHMWYQHSEHRDECYHFCTGLARDRYLEIGGFDERYAAGIAYDDDDFRDRVRATGIPFVRRNDAVVVHQKHQRAHERLNREIYRRLLDRNRNLYEAK